jgi:hypothetical protein
VESYRQTAHFNTSKEANARSIKGSFAPGHERLQTRASGLFFRMHRENGAYVQTAVDQNRGTTITKRFDLVTGSGRRGQTYLYWEDEVLFQLPVSWLAGADRWINSPGYVDGIVDFRRVIIPRCLECHATRFELVGPPEVPRYSKDYELGIGCQKCHGDGSRHVAYHLSRRPTSNPGGGYLEPGAFFPSATTGQLRAVPLRTTRAASSRLHLSAG